MVTINHLKNCLAKENTTSYLIHLFFEGQINKLIKLIEKMDNGSFEALYSIIKKEISICTKANDLTYKKKKPKKRAKVNQLQQIYNDRRFDGGSENRYELLENEEENILSSEDAKKINIKNMELIMKYRMDHYSVSKKDKNENLLLALLEIKFSFMELRARKQKEEYVSKIEKKEEQKRFKEDFKDQSKQIIIFRNDFFNYVNSKELFSKYLDHKKNYFKAYFKKLDEIIKHAGFKS